MSFFENMFGHKDQTVQPENMPTSPVNEPENIDDERHGGSLDENMSDFTSRLEKDEEENDLDQAA